jgi:hypothetical protein
LFQPTGQRKARPHSTFDFQRHSLQSVEDDATAEDVGLVVIPFFVQDFRSRVPRRAASQGGFGSIGQFSREAEVDQLESAVALRVSSKLAGTVQKNDVFGLEVAMNDPPCVTIGYRTQQRLHDVRRIPFRVIPLRHDLVEQLPAFQVFKNQMHVVFFFVDFKERDDVRV